MTMATATQPQMFSIRDGRPSDEAFILATWLRNYWEQLNGHARAKPECAACLQSKGLRKSVYYAGHHDKAEAAVRRAHVLIAHPTEHEDVILGYLVMEPLRDWDVIHWLYVKREMRGFGIALRLLGQVSRVEAARYTHRTSDFERMRKARWPEMVFDPYLF